ncbi:aldehyde dehydrogenase [Thermaerobacter composti]|uniref:Aldehyde dehydrogenase n=1 Tax=Thermaerobacter composti TaxID=554949 RepID=A0ABZ0QPC8_9FIRM|nr:aldehyde dehydrogenase [Thermaerobacter composti]WPD18534.1 aldehyde dehydrogenase [Thermaerobacter composti]
MVRTYGHLIDGEQIAAASGKTFPVENPATLEVVAEAADGDANDVARAVEASQTAFDRYWRRTTGRERAALLTRFAEIIASRVDQLAQHETIITGRPIREMRAQVGRIPDWYAYYAGIAQTAQEVVAPFGPQYLNYVQRLPLGVVGLITPWNHPLLILTKKLAPALAAGNTVVVKPSEFAPTTAVELAQLALEAGFPPGVLNVVTGYGPSAGHALAAHPGVAKIDLTGGTPTGKAVASVVGGRLGKVTMELGGKAPVLIFADADLDQAVAGALFAAFIAAGQTCVQGARILVEKTVYDQVTDALVSRANAIRLGDPLDPATQMGPLVSQRQLARTEQYVQIGLAEGARLVAGGYRPKEPPLDRGYYYRPTIFTDVKPHMRIFREEIFGPVTCVVPFADEEEAIRLANDCEYGLGAAVWTQDVKRAHRVAQRLEAGVVWVNDHHRIDPSSPWGGWKASGIGRENGWDAYWDYTQTRSVIVNLDPTPFDWYAGSERYS